MPVNEAPDWAEVGIAYAMEYALRYSEANDVVFLGDSTCAFGIVPLLLEEHAGLRAFNLGVFGGLEIDSFGIILRAYLEHHPKPRMVVFCLHPTRLRERPSQWTWLQERFMDMYGPKTHSRWTSGFSLRSASEECVLASRWLMTYYNFADVPVIPGGPTYHEKRDIILRQRGYYDKWLELDDTVNVPKLNPIAPVPVDAENKEQVVRVICVALEYEIPVMIRLTPIFGRAGTYNHAELDAWLDALRSRGDGKVVVSWPSLIEYEPVYSDDQWHCNPEGARKFTTFISEQIAGVVAEKPVSREAPPGQK